MLIQDELMTLLSMSTALAMKYRSPYSLRLVQVME